ncbi:MAG TPA: VCBS repeat-containing protein [Cyclobacteriaceae bacterium]|nr:VCBS repeat-containing protein [Cyclobacteriaceae bacterium]
MISLNLFILLSFLTPDPGPKFEGQVIDSNVSIGYGLAIGDVDGDKKPDILLADKKEFVWYRNGDWRRFVMVENLTESDNVCIAARDIDGDGKVEVAVGAQWNPGETSDTLKSGSVHYLIRPADPTQKWTPVELHHEPTIHRMKWVKASNNQYHLIVVPLHGRGNKNGEGRGVKIFAYQMPKDPTQPWTLSLIDSSMHLTHNLEVVSNGSGEMVYVAGKEGIKLFSFEGGKWRAPREWFVKGHSFGELRTGKLAKEKIMTGVEPMHGNELTVYFFAAPSKRVVLTSDLKQGHALATADFLGKGMDQIVIGWREPNSENKVGIKIFVSSDANGTTWKDYWVDDNTMACEDLQIADLNGDGRKDIIAAGRASHNLKVYWGR